MNDNSNEQELPTARVPSEVDWSQVDELLFAGNVLVAIKHIRTKTGWGIGEITQSVHERFDKLVREHSGNFKCDLKTYWDGYYS